MFTSMLIINAGYVFLSFFYITASKMVFDYQLLSFIDIGIVLALVMKHFDGLKIIRTNHFKISLFILLIILSIGINSLYVRNNIILTLLSYSIFATILFIGNKRAYIDGFFKEIAGFGEKYSLGIFLIHPFVIHIDLSNGFA
jgi:hypothetical protein